MMMALAGALEAGDIGGQVDFADESGLRQRV